MFIDQNTQYHKDINSLQVNLQSQHNPSQGFRRHLKAGYKIYMALQWTWNIQRKPEKEQNYRVYII